MINRLRHATSGLSGAGPVTCGMQTERVPMSPADRSLDHGRETSNDSRFISLGEINNTGNHLRKMSYYAGLMAVLKDALKKKGVRFDELSFEDGEIEYLNKDVMVLRGNACEIVHRSFERLPEGVARSMPKLQLGRGSVPHDTGRRGSLKNFLNLCIWKFGKVWCVHKCVEFNR